MDKREKVIKGLECKLMENGKRGCCDCPYDEEFNCIGCDALLRDALELLKAQEPVEPVFNAMVETDMSYWSCGACGAFIYGNAYPHMAKDTMPKYCGYCGRAVKWE